MEEKFAKLPLIFSVIALIVAIFGVTPIGGAAVNVVQSAAKDSLSATGLASAKLRRGPRGPRGFRGPRGLRGIQGLQGPKGDKGDKGDIGPSNAYYAHASTLTGLPAGDYVAFAQLVDNNTSATSGDAEITLGYSADAAGASAQAPKSTSYVLAGHTVTVPAQAIIHLPNGGGIGANTLTYGPFTVDITAIRVGSATP